MTETERLYARLLEIKSLISAVFGRYEFWILPVLRFLLAMTTLLLINTTLPYMGRLLAIPLVLVVSLVCALLPLNFTLIVSGGFILAHLYELSLEAAIVGLGLFLVMYLLYFRFSPRDAVIVLLTPLAFLLHIPYVLPLIAGLLGSLGSFLALGCGVAAYCFVGFIHTNAAYLGSGGSDEMIARVRFILDYIVNDKAMFVTIAAFAITAILVWFLRRLPLDYSWSIAIVAGVIADVVVHLIGDLMFETGMNVPGALLSSVFCGLIAFVIQFFAFNVDYKRAEFVQFEDDEYYYYVKALPKINVPLRDLQVKRIHTPMDMDYDQEDYPAYKRARKSPSRQQGSEERSSRYGSASRDSRSGRREQESPRRRSRDGYDDIDRRYR